MSGGKKGNGTTMMVSGKNELIGREIHNVNDDAIKWRADRSVLDTQAIR